MTTEAIEMDLGLKGRVAMITGPAKGMGAAVSRAFASEGCHINELIVAGRTVAREGRVLNIDHAAMNDELLARFRHGIARNASLAAALPHLERTIRNHFETPCC